MPLLPPQRVAPNLGYNMLMVRHLLIGLGCWLCLLTLAGGQSVEWSRLYIQSGERGFFPKAAVADSQGHLIVAGRYIRSGGHYSVAMFKYSPTGSLSWATTFGTSGESNFAEAVAVAPDDSIFLATTRANSDSTAYVHKYTPSGTLLWTQEINLSAYDVITQLVPRGDGGVEVLLAYGSGGIGYARLIYDASGNLIASHPFPQPNSWMANRIPLGMAPIDSTRTLLIVQDLETEEVLQSYPRTRLQVINSAGMVVAESVLPLRATRYGRDDAGQFYLLGDYWNPSAQQMRLRVACVDANLQLLGLWEISSADGDAIPDVLVVSGGSWLVSGGVEGPTTRGMAVEVRRSDGSLLSAQAEAGALRPVSGASLPGAFALLIGVLESAPQRWQPRIFWWRTNGQWMGSRLLPPLAQADALPEQIVASPDGALYVVATVNRDGDNMAGAGIWRLRGLPSLVGRVHLQSFVGNPATRTAQFDLSDGAQTDSVSLPLGANGEYALTTLLTGSVQVRLSVPGWLAKRQTLTLNGTVTADWDLLNGDANHDNLIDDADLLMVLFNFGQSGSNPADLNGDGSVDDADLLIVLFNFGAIGD